MGQKGSKEAPEVAHHNLTVDRILNNTKMVFTLERCGNDGVIDHESAFTFIKDLFSLLRCKLKDGEAKSIVTHCSIKRKQFSFTLFINWVRESFPEVHPSASVLLLENEGNIEGHVESDIVLSCGRYAALLLNKGKLWTFLIIDFTCGDTNQRIISPFSKETEEEILFVSCGLSHVALLSASGSIWTYGCNSSGALGNGEQDDYQRPKRVKSLKNFHFVSVACGMDFTSCVKDDGSIWMFGSNNNGQLANGYGGKDQHEKTPIEVQTLHNAQRVFCGGSYCFVICKDSSIYGCGSNSLGQLALGDSANRNLFACVTQKSSVVSIACGAAHSLFLLSDGSVYSCGYNFSGELGLGSNETSVCSLSLIKLPPIRSIACTTTSSMCIDEDFNLWAFGSNLEGQLALGENTVTRRATSPVKVDALSGTDYISSGYGGRFMAIANSSLWCCGKFPLVNAEGEHLPEITFLSPEMLGDHAFRETITPSATTTKSARK